MEQPIKKRILEIVTQQGKSITAICLNGNLTPSTLFDFIEGKSHCPKVSTIKKFCAGAGITLSEFFAPDYFNDTDDVYG